MTTEWRYVLEIGNGLWTIVCGYLAVFLGYHLLVVVQQRKLWSKPWATLPMSVQLAVGTWVSCLGVLLTRLVIFGSRVLNDGFLAMTSNETAVFAGGIFIGLAGFLCILRVATRPILGHWPWISCLICCAFYLLWETLRV